MKYLILALFTSTTVLAQSYNPGLPLPGLPTSLGQKISASSTSVTIASDQTPVPITGTIQASNPSVSNTGAAVPTYATFVGAQDQSGNLSGITKTALGVVIDGSGYVQQSFIENKLLSITGAVTGKVTADQGVPNSLLEAWPVKPTDGSHAQTFTAAGEAGVVVTQSLPPGNNILGYVKPTDGSHAQTFTAAGEAGVVLTQPIPYGTNVIGSVKVAPGTSGSETTNAAIGSGGATTLSPPANAIGFVLQTSGTNSANIRWAIGSVATTSSGQQLQPGRDTGFMPVNSSVSVIAESGSQEIQIQWVTQ